MYNPPSMADNTLTFYLQYLLLPSAILLLIPLGWLFYQVKKTLADEKIGKRSPFSEKLLRPPGESIRHEIALIEERLSEKLLTFLPLLIGPMATYLATVFAGPKISYPITLTVACISAFFLIRKWKAVYELRKQLRNHRLGFDAERVVASELQELVASGYRVFHDIVIEAKPGGEGTSWNIDHIAVGKNGVFVFETKGRRKTTPAPDSPLKDHEMLYENGIITFPNGVVTKRPVEQAKRNAKHVKKWLSKSVSGELTCHAIVAYPGWFVKSGKSESVKVLSAAKIACHIAEIHNPRMLKDDEILALAALLDEKCRNLDGAN